MEHLHSALPNEKDKTEENFSKVQNLRAAVTHIRVNWKVPEFLIFRIRSISANLVPVDSCTLDFPVHVDNENHFLTVRMTTCNVLFVYMNFAGQIFILPQTRILVSMVTPFLLRGIDHYKSLRHYENSTILSIIYNRHKVISKPFTVKLLLLSILEGIRHFQISGWYARAVGELPKRMRSHDLLSIDGGHGFSISVDGG